MRQIQVTIPRKKAPLVIGTIRNKCRVQNIVRLTGGNDILFILRVADEELSNTVKNLQDLGIGTQMGCLDVIRLEDLSAVKEASDQKEPAQPPSETQKNWWEKIFNDTSLST